MLWHDQKNGRPAIVLWDDCHARLPEYCCSRPKGHDGGCSVYSCARCGGVLDVEPDLRDPATGDTTRAHAAHVCDARPHPSSLRGREIANARFLDTNRIDPWVVVGAVDGRTPRHDPYFLLSDEPVFLGCFDEIDVWVTRDRFHAVVEEGTVFGWPRAMHRSPSHSHRSFMLRALRNFTRRVNGERGGPQRVESSLGPTRDLLDEIEIAIDGWMDEQGLGKNETRP